MRAWQPQGNCVNTDQIYPAHIKEVLPSSPAERAGVRPGDQLLLVDGEPITDILAYRNKLERGRVTLTIAQTGPNREMDLKNAPRLDFTVDWEEPGLEFEEVLFDGIKKCANKCDFCYIHQMPRGFRKSLYIMDDDYRLSFLYGSFVTLTNLTEADLNRIVDENLSPLYVSVHTTSQERRQDLMKWWRLKVKDDRMTDIRHMIERLESIDLYTQIVMLPGRNDGDAFEETLEYLAHRPNVISVAAVPVGLTDHRNRLSQIETFDSTQAKDVLRRAHKWRQQMLSERGTRFVFPSDEFYLIAGEPIPTEEEYEGFPMLENGVGMIRDFLNEPMPPLPPEVSPRKIILATGTLFAETLSRALEPLKSIEGLNFEVRAIVNRAFGSATTVAGLLTGLCFKAAIEPGEADLLIVPPTTLRYGTELMLDDISLSDLAIHLGFPVAAGGSTLAELVRLILGNTVDSNPSFGWSAHAVKEQRGRA
ncbi:MAG: DUF512 domain-containing protein [Deinococcaceae bacterium]